MNLIDEFIVGALANFAGGAAVAGIFLSLSRMAEIKRSGAVRISRVLATRNEVSRVHAWARGIVRAPEAAFQTFDTGYLRGLISDAITDPTVLSMGSASSALQSKVDWTNLLVAQHFVESVGIARALTGPADRLSSLRSRIKDSAIELQEMTTEVNNELSRQNSAALNDQQ